jgi:hypothetical protein
MSLVDLGTSVVLDATNMNIGMHLVINGQVFVISQIQSQNVVLRPLTTLELIKFRLMTHKILSCSILAAVAIIVIRIIVKG